MLITDDEQRWVCEFPLLPLVVAVGGGAFIAVFFGSIWLALLIVIPCASAIWLSMAELIMVRDDLLLRLTCKGWTSRQKAGQQIIVGMKRSHPGGGLFDLDIAARDQKPWSIMCNAQPWKYGVSVSRALDIPVAQKTFDLYPRIIRELERPEHDNVVVPFSVAGCLFVLLISTCLVAHSCEYWPSTPPAGGNESNSRHRMPSGPHE